MNIGDEQKTKRGGLSEIRKSHFFASILEKSKLAQNCIIIKNKVEMYEYCQVEASLQAAQDLKRIYNVSVN